MGGEGIAAIGEARLAAGRQRAKDEPLGGRVEAADVLDRKSRAVRLALVVGIERREDANADGFHELRVEQMAVQGGDADLACQPLHARQRQIPMRPERGCLDRLARTQGQQGLPRCVWTHGGESGQPVLAAASGRRLQIDDFAAAHRALQVVVAQDHTVANFDVQRLCAGDIHRRRAAGRQRCAVHQQQPALAVAGGVVDVDRRVVAHGAGKVVHDRQPHGERRGWKSKGAVQQPVAAPHVGKIDASEVDGGPVSWASVRRLRVLDAQAAHPCAGAG